MSKSSLPPLPKAAPPPSKWVVHLPDHSETLLEGPLDVGRACPADAVREALAPYADVSREHLRLEAREGRLRARHLSTASVTFVVTRRGGKPCEEALAPHEREVPVPAVFRLGDHAYIMVRKDG